MLRKQTVFILGAGASAPYQFSTGRGQLNDARTYTAEQLAERFSPVSRKLAPQLLTRLLKTGEPSIDAMLRPDSPLVAAAKGIIARDLFRVEQVGRTPPSETSQHWYRALFSNMPRGTYHEAINAPVRIFTFNYDRSLDRFLWDAFSAQFQHENISDAQIGALLAAIGPIHLHGQLGRLHAEMPGAGAVVPYGGSDERGPTDTDMLVAIDQIKLISETNARDKPFAQLHYAITQAERVIFLGFGFHEDNVLKLRIKENLPPTAAVFASGMGLTEQQMGHFKHKYGLNGMVHGHEAHDVARFLATFPQTLDHPRVT
jgi:hypothetical protein